MKENEAKKTIDEQVDTVVDKALDIFEQHPMAVTFGFLGLLAFGALKVCEGSISRAMYKANAKTVDYILQQFRYLR